MLNVVEFALNCLEIPKQWAPSSRRVIAVQSFRIFGLMTSEIYKLGAVKGLHHTSIQIFVMFFVLCVSFDKSSFEAVGSNTREAKIISGGEINGHKYV